MTTIFDSAHLVNPLCFTGRSFAVGIEAAPAVAPLAWPEWHGPGSNPNRPTDADDPTDFAPRFHPAPDDERWAAQTSPLNADDDEARALDSLADFRRETDAEWFARYEANPADWSEHDALVNANGALSGHPDRIDA